MDTVIIRDFDTALDAIIESYAHPDFDSFELSPETNLRIKLVGEQWDGEIDYKVAEFVVKLQKELITIYNEHTDQKIRYNTRVMEDAGLRVTVKVEKGCSLFTINLDGWWANMESEHQLVAILGVAAIFAIPAGIFFWRKYSAQEKSAEASIELAKIEKQAELENKIQSRIQDEVRQKEASAMVGKALQMVGQASSYMYFLASKMQPNDNMTINDVQVQANDAKQLFRSVVPSEERQDGSRYFIDGEYVVTAINREKEEVKIRISDRIRKFSLTWLEGVDLENFYKNCAQRKNDQPLPPMNLQLTAFFKGGIFQHGFIQGVGSRREGAVTVEDAILASVKQMEDESTGEVPMK